MIIYECSHVYNTGRLTLKISNGYESFTSIGAMFPVVLVAIWSSSSRTAVCRASMWRSRLCSSSI